MAFISGICLWEEGLYNVLKEEAKRQYSYYMKWLPSSTKLHFSAKDIHTGLL